MATYTSNYGWTKPSGSDNVDISVLNDNLDDQDSTIHDAFLNMAPPFSEPSTYAVDDIVLYGTGLYKCHTAVVTPGSWTGSTNWQVYKLSEGGGGGGGTSNYNDLTNKPSINGVELSGNKTTSDLGIDKTAVGLGNVPNVSTNDQTPTFTQASTRNNIASGEKLSVILGKIAKFFNDLKTVAFSGSFSDLSNKPSINSVELSGNKTTGDLGINANNVMMSDGVTSVAEKIGNVRMTKSWENPSPTSSFAGQNIQLLSSDYDFLMVMARYSTSDNKACPVVIGKNGYINFSDYSSGSSTVLSFFRAFNTSRTTVTFSDAKKNGANDNSFLIPTVIYNIKLT